MDGTSRNPKHRCLITKGFQVSEHLLDPQMEESRHIFTKKPSGPENGETADHFRPEITVIRLASSLPGNTEGLAREAAADEIDFLDELPVNASDVGVTGHRWPMFAEDSSAILIYFHLPRDCEPSPFQTQIEAADAGKQTTDPHASQPNLRTSAFACFVPMDRASAT